MRRAPLLATLVLVLGAAAPAPCVPAPPAKQPRPRVVVSTVQVYEGIVLTADQLRVRELRDDELAAYRGDPEQYLRPDVKAALLRVPVGNMPADRPLRFGDFDDLANSLPIDVKRRAGPRPAGEGTAPPAPVGPGAGRGSP